MAKKPAARGRADLPVSPDAPQRVLTKLKPSALLDTRVFYCGDNLEQLAKLPDACDKRMQKEEVRMMKPAHSPILHSSFFLLNSPMPASHYVKVMLGQIFGENNFLNEILNEIVCEP
jgi:hypothetical protein